MHLLMCFCLHRPRVALAAAHAQQPGVGMARRSRPAAATTAAAAAGLPADD